METLSKDAFIETTLKTQKNEQLESAINESKERIRQFKTLANSDNKFVRIIAWFFVIILIFFAFPMILTGFLSKGMRWKEQTMLWTAIILVIIIYLLKNSLF